MSPKLRNWRSEEIDLPSQKQLKWSQLRVGLTVIFASVTLALLLFLMSGTGGLFTKRITLMSYFDNASGLRVGAPVRLSGVDIGNVVDIRVVPDKDKQITPVEVIMKVEHEVRLQPAPRFGTSLDTAGVLGETYLDIDSSQAIGPRRPGWRYASHPRSSRLQRGGAIQPEHAAEHGCAAQARRPHPGLRRKRQGLAGQIDLRSQAVRPLLADGYGVQEVVDEIAKGQGSLGKLINNNDAYNKFVATLDKMNAVVDDLQAGKGTAGKFLKDPISLQQCQRHHRQLEEGKRRHQCRQGHCWAS